MRKGLVKKFWIFMVSLLMIIGNMQSFVFAEDRSKSSVTTQAQVTSIQIKDSSGNWVDLAPRTVIKDGTEVNIVGQYTVSNLENTDEDIDIYVNLEPQNMNIENTDAHEISTDSLGSKWKIDEGQLHLRITSGYADKHQNITGGFNVPGRISIDKTKYNKGDSVEVKIGDKTVSITFDNGEIESSLNASKEAVGNITKGADGKLYQSYKVNLYAQNGDVTLNSVTDILGSKQVLASKVTFTNTSKDNITSSTEYTNFTDIQNITIAEGKTATLEYTVKVDGTEDLTKANLADVETYGNRFKANYTTDENQKKETDEVTSNVKIQHPTVDKSGKVTNDGKITWTITINLGSHKDVVSGYNGKLDSIISDFKDTPDAAQRGGSVNLSDFKETLPGSGIWIATYETTVAPGINTTNGYTFKNDVDFKLNGDSKHAQGEAIIGSTSQLITKSFDRIEGTNVLVWNVNLTLNEGITDVILTDSPDYKSSVSYIAINDPADGEKVLYDAGVDKDDLTDYGKSITVENMYRWHKKLAFTEAFLNEHKNTTVNFICKTTLSGNPSSNFKNNEEYTNSAAMSYKVDGIDKKVTANASYKYTTDLDKTGQVDTKENKINYTISIAVDKNTGLEKGKAYTITDSIDSDFIIDADSISGKYYDFTGNSDWIGNDVQKPSINYDAGTHTFTYTVAKDFLDIVNANPTKKYQIKIMYSAVPKDLNEFYKHEKTEVTNRAQGMYDGEDIGSAITQTTIVPKTVVNKTGTQKNTDGTQNSYATYTISVNEFGVKLNNGNPLRGEDVLNKNLIYQLSSITVKNSKTGECLLEGTYSYSYDQENNSLTFVLPDETPITISYKASINLPIGSTMNEENSGNTFTLYGDSETTSGSSKIKLDGEFKPSVTITGENAELSIVKYDVDHIDTKLSGAKFALIEAVYNKANDTFTEGQKTEIVTGADGRATFKGVSLDQIYILRELEAPRDYVKATDIYCVFEGHSFNLLNKPGENSTHKLVVFKNKSMEYPVGDKKIDEKLGSIKVTKNVEGLATGTNGPGSIDFTVTKDEDSSFAARTLTVTRNADGSYTEATADKLPLGTYTVTEGKADVTGYTLKKTTYKVGETETNSVTLSKEVSDQTVAVTNTYSKDVGKLTFTKSFSGAELTKEQTSGISFTVKNVSTDEEVGTYRLADIANSDGSYSKTIEGLPVGNYEVIETNAEVNGYTVTTTYKVNGTDSDKGAVEIAKDSENTVAIANNYTQDVGKLTFTKSFSGDELTKEQTSGISFTVKNVSTTEVVGTYRLADIANSDESYSKTIENLPVGKYEVIETNAEVNGYTVTTTYKVNGTDSEKGVVELSKDSENTVAITNNYSKKVGHLTFTKVFENHEVSAEDESNITFKIQDSEGNAVAGYEAITLGSLTKSGGTYSYTTRDDLEIGKSYKVVEASINKPAGWTVTTTYKVGEGEAKAEAQTVEVSETTANTEIKNSYTQDVGKLTFTKSFSGAELTKEQTSGISFTVKNVSTDEEVGTYRLADIANSDGSYSKTIEGLPVGNYEVIETNAEVNGYTVTTTYKVNGTDSDKGAVEIAKDSENTVAITNNYIQLVSYTVKKEWNLNGTEGVMIPETITVQLTANGNSYGDRVVLHASESESDNWTYTWDNLPKSDAAREINYSVKEIEAPEGYTVSAVTDTESRVITLTNTYTNGREVTFSKEDVAGKELPGATMSISVKNGEEVSRWVSTSEKNVVTLAPGNYTLTELTAPNGYLKAQSIDFTLDAEGKVTVDGNPVSEVVMVDEYASHDVIISKVDAANNKELAGAVLKVTDKDGNEVDKWTSEEGKNHTVTVKPGTYTFTEVSAPKGYELAESITFNVDLNGKVTIDGKEVTAVVMKDAKKPTNVQTGVHTNVGGFGALGGCSIGMAFIVLFLRKKMD